MTDTEKQLTAAAKAELSEYHRLLEVKRWYEGRILEVRAQAVKITQTLTGTSGGGQTVPVAQRTVEQLEQLAEQYADHITGLNAHTARLLSTLEQVENPVYRALLKKRYLDGISLKRACFEVDCKGRHYSYDWMRHLHRNALLSYGKAMAGGNT